MSALASYTQHSPQLRGFSRCCGRPELIAAAKVVRPRERECGHLCGTEIYVALANLLRFNLKQVSPSASPDGKPAETQSVKGGSGATLAFLSRESHSYGLGAPAGEACTCGAGVIFDAMPACECLLGGISVPAG